MVRDSEMIATSQEHRTMGEEILKLNVNELTTIRIIKDGIATEMSIDKLDSFFATNQEKHAAAFRQLAVCLNELAAKPHGIETQFVIPIKR
jgi:hypothetical protein